MVRCETAVELGKRLAVNRESFGRDEKELVGELDQALMPVNTPGKLFVLSMVSWRERCVF